MSIRPVASEHDQFPIQFHGSGIQNHNSTFRVGRDITINNLIPQTKLEKDNEHRRKVLKSLQFEQMNAREQDIKRAHAKTCQWFLETQQYQSWLNMNKSQAQGEFLWVKGKPGSGKSTLIKFALSHTARILKNTENRILSFFFNARGSDLEKSTIGLYRALLVQLLRACPNQQDVLDDFEVDRQWSTELVKDIFEQTLQKLNQLRLVCFIDALDECKEQEVREMISWLDMLSCENRLHVCFASRHYPHIAIRKGLKLILESQEQHGQDISCYLKDNLYFEDDRALAEEIRADLQMKASGIFMWVVLVVEILNREYDAGHKHSLRETLQRIPKDLHDLFRNIITHGTGPNRALLLCLQWILFARTPLTSRQLYFAILSGTEPNYLVPCHSQDVSDDVVRRYILHNSRGLAVTTKSGQPTVQFIHESVKDFLLTENGLGTIWQDLKTNLEGRSQEALRQCCSQYKAAIDGLLHQMVSSKLPLPRSYEMRRLHEYLDHKYPLLEYATHGILFHAEQAQRWGIEQEVFLHHFPLETWIGLHNIYERWEERWYTRTVSLLYVLSDMKYWALIRTSGLLSCFDVEESRCIAPILMALVTKSYATAESLIESLTQSRASTCDSCRDPLALLRSDYDMIVQNTLNRYQAFHHHRGVASYLAEFGCCGLLEIYLNTQESSVDYRDKDSRTPLMYAAGNGHVAVMQLLIDRGADANAYNNDGETALCYASELGSTKMVELLLYHSVDIHVRPKSGSTPLHNASSGGHTEIVKLLLDNGADVNARTARGKTPLQLASLSGYAEIVRLLLDHRVELDGRTELWKTPLQLASLFGHTEIVKMLLDYGVDVNGRTEWENTPLQLASSLGHTEIVKLLLDYGVDVNARIQLESTPLDLASALGHTDIVRLLLDSGAHSDYFLVPPS